MNLYTLSLVIILLATSFLDRCRAEEVVFGPPTLIIDAHIDTNSPGDDDRFLGSVLSWEETRQTWNRTAEINRRPQGGPRVSMAASRAVFILQSRQFVASMRVLRFSRLDGEAVDASDVAKLLVDERAVAFVPKGCAIDPSIANALHPDTLVVTRVSYPTDPILIPLPQRR